MKSLSVYIHIPFCVQKCHYCDFLSAPANERTREDYVRALKREIENESESYREYIVKTVFFGGGTPSILSETQIAEIIQCLRSHFIFDDKMEISLEMNPATANRNKIKAIHEAGVNRLSIGLQSTSNEELKTIGRIHSYEDFLDTYRNARECGFTNINIDLMSALPGQTYDSYVKTLQRVIALAPEHISAYSLIVEENTPLYENLENYPPIPSEDEDRKMYASTLSLLNQVGYERYEISNYSKPGYECKHNITYWQRGDYVGFGIGAASFVQEKRWKNVEDINIYIKEYTKDEVRNSIKTELVELSYEDRMEEFMFLGLRMMKGISISDFSRIFNVSIFEIYGATLKKWIDSSYLIQNGDKIYFSKKGIDVSNQILSEFLF